MVIENLELSEQQHLEMQELVEQNQLKVERLLKAIIDAISVEKIHDDIVKAISKIKQIEFKQGDITIEPPAVNVNVNQDRVVSSLSTATEAIVDKLDELKTKPVEKKLEKWRFIFLRDQDGIIISATAEQIK